MAQPAETDRLIVHSELTEVVILFGAAVAAAWLLRLARAPSICGFLIAGILLGNFGRGVLDPERIHFFADLGLALVMFVVGLELSAEPLLRMGWRLVVASGLQIGITAGMGALLFGLLSGAPLTANLLVGVVVAISSTAIALKQLSDRRETDSAAGSLTAGIALVQDVVVIALMLMLPFLARPLPEYAQTQPTGGRSVFMTALLSLGGAALCVAVGRVALPWLVRQIARQGQELLTLLSVLLAVLGAWLADLADWSWALGSCIAGLLLAQTELRHQLRAEITPFRDTFNALFFITIGMLVDLRIVAENAGLITLLVVLCLIGKTLITGLSVRIAGWPLRVSFTAGVWLCTISEFSYVLAKEAESRGLLAPELQSILVAWTVGTMLIGAVLVPVGERIAGVLTDGWMWLAGAQSISAVEQDEVKSTPHRKSDVIIIGYGLNGRNLARVLRATGITHTVVDQNPSAALQARRDNTSLIVGDATRLAILEEAGLREARALVISVAETHSTRMIIAQVKASRPELWVLARTRYVSEIETLLELGSNEVIPEEFETSIEIFSHVLRQFGVPNNVIDQQITLVRAGRYGMLRGRPTDRAARQEWLKLLEQATTQTYMLLDGSPAAGQTIRDLNLRARLGVTIVALTRGGQPIANPTADMQLLAGDVLVLVGTHRQLREVEDLLRPASHSDAQAAPA